MDDAFVVTVAIHTLVMDDRPNTVGDAQEMVHELISGATNHPSDWDGQFRIIVGYDLLSVEPEEE